MVGVIVGFYQVFLTESIFQDWPTVSDNELHYWHEDGYQMLLAERRHEQRRWHITYQLMPSQALYRTWENLSII